MSDEEPKTRSGAERYRLRHSISRLRGILDSVERAIEMGGPIGGDVAQAIFTGTSEVVMQIAKHDAFDLYEQDAKNRMRPRPKPCGADFVSVEPGRLPGKRLVCKEGTRCSSCAGALDQWTAGNQRNPF